MEPVRRPSDGELCGYVAPRGEAWVACVVFGAEIGVHADRDAAVAQVTTEGLAALAERWTLVDVVAGTEELVCIGEVAPGRVTVVRDLLPMPGSPTLTLTSGELAGGTWELRR